ncbi:MAG TPA: peptidoglycan-binding domain-containing protein [Nitrococcus sp.]|nr:peptidoglycan-binding domain-containing protein [Nitrococcus sp.]
MNKWRRHIATGVIALGVASMIPGLALAQANTPSGQGTGPSSDQQTNGQSHSMGSGISNSNGPMGSGMSQHQKMSKHEVMQIQTALNQAGEHVTVDGIMGPNTRSALRKYQESNGLPATGRPNEQTLQKLGVPNQNPGTNQNPGSNQNPGAY